MLGLYRHPFHAMGSRCEIRLYAGSEDEAAAIARSATVDVERLDAKYSSYRDDSVTAAINRVGTEGGAIEVDAETASLLDYADTCFEQSEGLFDLTSGVLREAWDAHCKALPDATALERLLERVGWDKLLWSRPRLEFGMRGMALDFG